MPLTITADRLTALPGEEVGYSLAFSNTGPDPVPGLVISFNVPEQFALPPNEVGFPLGDIPAFGSVGVTATLALRNDVPADLSVVVNAVATSNGKLVGQASDEVDIIPPTRVIGVSGSLALGQALVGERITATLIVSNTGTAPLTVTGINLPTGFSVNWSGGTIVAGGLQNITVTFAPTSIGSYIGVVTIVADQTAGNTIIPSSGEGVTSLTRQTLMTMQEPSGTGNSSYELGVRVISDASGSIVAVRFWKISGDVGTHIGHIWDASGRLLASVTFVAGTPVGWQEQALAVPVSVLAGVPYVVSVNANALWPNIDGFFATSVVRGHLTGTAGLYGSPGVFPTTTFQGYNYMRDLVFVLGDSVPPAKVLGITDIAAALAKIPALLAARGIK